MAAKTAYPKTEAALRDKMKSAVINKASFERPLKRCDLSECHGMCCYDGVYISDETAEVLADLAVKEADFFQKTGVTLPDKVVEDASWREVVAGKKTATRPHPFSKDAKGFPAHFNDTVCVFWMRDGRCSLQALAQARGLHPWFYKPFGCWLHPISVNTEDGGVVTLYDERSDPYSLPGYAGYVASTQCGQTDGHATPAWEVLESELEFLGGIVGLALSRQKHP